MNNSGFPEYKDEQPVFPEREAIDDSLKHLFKREEIKKLLRFAAAKGFRYVPLEAIELARARVGERDLLSIVVEYAEQWYDRLQAIALEQLRVEAPEYAERLGKKFLVLLHDLPVTVSAAEICADHVGKLIQTHLRLDRLLTPGVVVEEECGEKIDVQRWLTTPLPSKRIIVQFRGVLASGVYSKGLEVEVTGIVKLKRKRLVIEVVSEKSLVDKFYEAFNFESKREAEVKVEQKQPSALRTTVSFLYVKPVYTKTEVIKNTDGEVKEVKTIWRLFKASRLQGDPGVLIFDSNGFVNERRLEYSLRVVDKEILQEVSRELPPQLAKFILTSLGSMSFEDLWLSGRILTPVPRLRDPSILTTIDWRREVVENIVNFREALRYEPLKTVRKATLLRGITQEANAHSIIVLPGQTGKSEFYKAIGILADRTTSRSLIGYADTSGPHPGSLHGCDLPFAIDQLEESEAWEILRYVLGLMESGTARVDTAAYPFEIQSLSPIIFLANPIGASLEDESFDPKKDFALLLLHLSRNPASGRRFGVILYDYDREKYRVPRIEKREKDLRELLSDKIQLFRAVEEYCRPRIKEIVSELWDWLNRRNQTWIDSALEVIEPLKENHETRRVYEFLTEFIYNGNTHTRGAALNIAIAENLDRIALNDISTDELLNVAEEHLHDILEINYQSLVNITQSYEQVMEREVARIFDTLPAYLKEIISAVEWLRRKKSLKVPLKVSLRSLPYTPESRDYFSKVLDDARKSNPGKYKEKLKSFFGFELTKDLDAIIYRAKPIERIQPLGSFGDFRPFGDFENLGEKTRTLGTTEEAGGEYKPSPEEMHERRDSTPLLERSKIPKTPKIPKRLVCRRCLEELKEAGDLLEVCGRAETSMASCEICGERPGAFWVRIRWDQGGGQDE